MGLERYVVDAVLVEGRSPTAIAKAHGLSRSWLYELISRFHQGGYEALEPRSRRPHSCSHQVDPSVGSAIVQLRQELIEGGHDAGALTIAHHLAERLAQPPPSVATIWRILKRQGPDHPPAPQAPALLLCPFRS